MTLIDTDVLLDDALDRYPFSDDSRDFLDRLEQTSVGVFVSWHSISNLYYIASRERGDESTRRFIRRLLSFARIAETTTEDLRYALGLDMRDFEDAMQVAAAYACKAQRIVTRNIRDFSGSPMPALTPRDALTELF